MIFNDYTTQGAQRDVRPDQHVIAHFYALWIFEAGRQVELHVAFWEQPTRARIDAEPAEGLAGLVDQRSGKKQH
jgi:hypothetical protein